MISLKYKVSRVGGEGTKPELSPNIQRVSNKVLLVLLA